MDDNPNLEKHWYRVGFRDSIYCFVDVCAQDAKEARRIAETASESECLHIDHDPHWEFDDIEQIDEGDVAQPYNPVLAF